MNILKVRLREFKLSGICNSIEERLSFAKEKKNIVFIGNPGTGKMHLAISIAIKALMKGHKVLFTSVSEMLQNLNASKADNSYYQKVSYYLSPDLLILDELGFKKLPGYSADDLFQNNLKTLWKRLSHNHNKQNF